MRSGFLVATGLVFRHSNAGPALNAGRDRLGSRVPRTNMLGLKSAEPPQLRDEHLLSSGTERAPRYKPLEKGSGASPQAPPDSSAGGILPSPSFPTPARSELARRQVDSESQASTTG